MKPFHQFIMKFAVLTCVGVATLLSETWAPTLLVHRTMSRLVASTTGWLVGALGLPAFVDGTSVYSLGYSVRIVSECNGLVPLVVVLAAAGMLRAPLQSRISLLLSGSIGVLAFNQLRILTTIVIGTRSARAADVAHTWVFPLLVLLIVASAALAWLNHELPREGFVATEPAL